MTTEKQLSNDQSCAGKPSGTQPIVQLFAFTFLPVPVRLGSPDLLTSPMRAGAASQAAPYLFSAIGASPRQLAWSGSARRTYSQRSLETLLRRPPWTTIGF
jgi:hypothetical protein